MYRLMNKKLNQVLSAVLLTAALLAGETAQAMQIFVHRMSNDQTITLEVEPTDSYEAIKAKIQEKLTIAPVRQWLVYGDKKLEDGKTLSDDNIQAGSTIKLYLTTSTNGFCGVETVNGGANVTWTYNKTSHTLTIGGTGVMQDLLWDNTNNVAPATPWDAYKTETTTIVIGNDVTYIGAYAFYGHTALTSVSIGSGVTTIGQNSFERCTALTEITVPEGVTGMDYAVFRNCTALATVNGGNGVTRCSSSVFRNTSWLESQNTVQTTDVIYFGKVALLAKEGVYGSVSIADGTVGIANNAFSSCIDLYAITIPASVTNIGQRAFFGCLYLESVTLLPATPPTMGGQAFNNIGKYTYDGRKFYFHGTAYGSNAYSDWNDMYNNVYVSQSTDFSTWTTTVLGTLTLSGGATTSTAVFVSDATSNYYKQGTTITLGHGDAPAGYVADYTVKDTNDGDVTVTENAGVYTFEMPASDVTVTATWTPANIINVTANKPAARSDYWATFYHPEANYAVPTGITIYKGKIGSGNVELTDATGNSIIPAGQAVVLNYSDANITSPITLTKTMTEATGDYTGNDLKGGATVTDGYMAYTLANGSHGVGFYKYNGSGLSPIKAHLEIATPSSPAPAFFGFDGGGENTTDINEHESHQSHEFTGDYYTLDGRKLQGKPTQKGIYVRNGRKIIIK